MTQTTRIYLQPATISDYPAIQKLWPNDVGFASEWFVGGIV